MKKRILSILLAVLMLSSLQAVSVFATAENGYVQNFNTVSPDSSTGWKTLTDSSWYTGTPLALGSGLGGRAADDKSLMLMGGGKYFANYFKMNGTQVLEFDVLFQKKTANEYQQFNFTREDGSLLAGDEIFHITGSYGKNRWDAPKLNAERWNHFAYEFNNEANTYALYINGTKIKDGTLATAFSASGQQFRFQRVGDKEDIVYLDDVKLTEGSYDAAKASVTISGAAGATGITIDASKQTVTMPDVTVDSVASKLAVTNGSFLGVVDPETLLTKTGGSVAEGDLLAFLAADGMTYHYYTVGIAKEPETASFSQNFSNVTANSEGWTTINGSEYLCPGTISMGISGKAADDKSVNLPRANAYYRRDAIMYGKTTIEYSLLKKDTTNCFMAKDGENRWLLFGAGNTIYTQGGFSTEEDAVGTYDLGKWYRVAFELDFSTGQYNAYVNGQKLIAGAAIPAQSAASGKTNQLRFTGNSYIDDVKISSGAYTAPVLATITSADSSKAVVNAQAKTVVLKDAVAVSDIASVLTASTGGAISVVDSVAWTTKASGNVSNGDWIAVRAADGVTFDYYTVIPEDSVSAVKLLQDGQELAGNTAEPGSVTAAVDISYSDSSAPYTATLIIAVYNQNGSLAAVEPTPITIRATQGSYVSQRYTTAAVTVAAGQSVKAFLWSNMASMKPVQPSRTLNVSGTDF